MGYPWEVVKIFTTSTFYLKSRVTSVTKKSKPSEVVIRLVYFSVKQTLNNKNDLKILLFQEIGRYFFGIFAAADACLVARMDAWLNNCLNQTSDFRILRDLGQPHSSTLRCLRRQTHIWPARLPFFFFPMLRSYFFSFLQLSGSFSYLLRAPLTTMLQKSTKLKHQSNV